MLSKFEFENARGLLAALSLLDCEYAIYGTGEVGRTLLKLVRSAGFREPAFFIDDAKAPGSLEGLDIIKPTDADGRGLRAVLLGTNAFQKAMAESLKAAFKGEAPRVLDVAKTVKFNAPSFESVVSASAVPASVVSASAVPAARLSADDYEYGWRVDKSFFERQAAKLDDMRLALAKGTSLNDVLAGFDGSLFGERIAEYPNAFEWLGRYGGGAKLLDIGCVMNNESIAGELKKACSELWFCNPAAEPNKVGFPVFYHLAKIHEARFAENSFDLVSCLSTIEHIGFDNSHYGDTSKPLYLEPDDRPMLETLDAILRWLKPGGRFLVSVPFGKRGVYKHRLTKRPAFQLFDHAATMRYKGFVEARGSEMEVVVYQGGKDGWLQLGDPASCDAPYAHGFPGAQAVALFKGRKARHSAI
jgi:SAM-dependent methyltransferase